MPEINTTALQQYGTKYTRTLQRLLQEDNSKLEPFFTLLPNCVGKEVNIPFMGKAKMSRITSPFQDIEQMNESKFGNIVMKPVPFYDVHKFSNDNKVYNNNIDFTMQNIITEVRAAANRQRDEVLMGVYYNESDGCNRKLVVGAVPVSPYEELQSSGILGTAYLGLSGGTLDDLDDVDSGDDLTTNVVEADFAYSGSPSEAGMVIGKIVRGIELLKKRHALIRGVNTPVIALTARQIAEVQLWEQAQNQNYGFGNLVDGFKNKILGINILETEMLPMADIGGGKKARICPMWIKEHALYGIWNDVSMRVTPSVERGVNYGQVVTQMSIGATRKHKESVIQIQCVEEFAAA